MRQLSLKMIMIITIKTSYNIALILEYFHNILDYKGSP